MKYTLACSLACFILSYWWSGPVASVFVVLVDIGRGEDKSPYIKSVQSAVVAWRFQSFLSYPLPIVSLPSLPVFLLLPSPVLASLG